MTTTMAWEALTMRKSSLRFSQTDFSPTQFVEEGAAMARDLIARERPKAGSDERAMRTVEAVFGVPYSDLWALKYRRPKRIAADLFARLHAAVAAQRDMQLRLLADEQAHAQDAGRSSAFLVRAADALAGSPLGEEGVSP